MNEIIILLCLIWFTQLIGLAMQYGLKTKLKFLLHDMKKSIKK